MKRLGTAFAVASLVALAGLMAPAASARSVSSLPRSSPTFNGQVEAMVVKGSTIYVVGEFTRASDSRGTQRRNHVAAINALTGRLLPWRASTNGVAFAVTYFRNQIFVGGDFTRAGGVDVSGLARISAVTGKVSPTFRPRVSDTVRALAATRHRVYLGGDFFHVSGKSRSHLAAVRRKTGALVGAWDPRVAGSVRALRVHRGRVYAGGEFSMFDGDPTHAHLVAVRRHSGVAVPSFRPHLHYPVLGLTFVKRRVVVAGGGAGGKLVVLRRSGTKVWRRTFDGDVNTVAVVGGRIYAGGHWTYICSSNRVGPHMGSCVDAQFYRPRLASFTLRGKRTHWAPEPDSPQGVLTMANADKRLAVGGDFDHFLQGSAQVTQPKFALFDRR